MFVTSAHFYGFINKYPKEGIQKNEITIGYNKSALFAQRKTSTELSVP